MYILILFIIMMIFILIGLFLLIYSFIGKEKIKLVPKDKNANPCIIIPARDESKVIENLLISITNQTVKIPSENVYIVVESLNDKTCEIAKKYSMNIVLRKDLSLRRKSYAIDDAIKEIMSKKKKYDLYFIFDADNVLDKNYMKHMLESYKKGYQVATGYRNTKNGNSSVVAAASSLTFTMVNTLFNRKKKKKNYAMTVSGTGFYISGEIIEDLKGYPFNSLTEDYEFSLYMVINNISSTYNEDAIFYDEQPTSYEVSKKQRTRWARGYLDTRIKYLNKIREKMYDKDTKNKKAITNEYIGIKPYIFMIIGILLFLFGNIIMIFSALIIKKSLLCNLFAILLTLIAIYIVLMMVTYVMIRSEKNTFGLDKKMKIKAIFYNPIFLLSYIPCVIDAIENPNLGWEKIEHNTNIDTK